MKRFVLLLLALCLFSTLLTWLQRWGESRLDRLGGRSVRHA